MSARGGSADDCGILAPPVMRAFPLLLAFLLPASGASAGGVTWTDRGASAIKRMNFDGTSLVTVAISGAVTSPGTNIRGVALDLAGGRMFWEIGRAHV